MKLKPLTHRPASPGTRPAIGVHTLSPVACDGRFAPATSNNTPEWTRQKKDAKRSQTTALTTPRTRFVPENEPKTNPPETPIQLKRTHQNTPPPEDLDLAKGFLANRT